jgi:hypothetical protein
MDWKEFVCFIKGRGRPPLKSFGSRILANLRRWVGLGGGLVVRVRVLWSTGLRVRVRVIVRLSDWIWVRDWKLG